MALNFQDISQGSIGGGSALAATGNPWAIGAGVIGGGILGALQEEEDPGGIIAKNNRLTLQGLKQQNQLGGLNLKTARRLDKEDTRATQKKNTISRQLGNLFSRL